MQGGRVFSDVLELILTLPRKGAVLGGKKRKQRRIGCPEGGMLIAREVYCEKRAQNASTEKKKRPLVRKIPNPKKATTAGSAGNRNLDFISRAGEEDRFSPLYWCKRSKRVKSSIIPKRKIGIRQRRKVALWTGGRLPLYTVEPPCGLTVRRKKGKNSQKNYLSRAFRQENGGSV